MLRIVLSAVALLLAFAAPALAATLTGEVTYAERIDLPPGATLAVRLVDLANPDSRRVEAEAPIASPGQVPLTFTLNFDDRVILAGHRYGIIAEITADDRLWFRNIEPLELDPLHPVAPLTVLVTFAGQIVDRGTGVTPPAPSPLLDVTWQATAINGQPTASGVKSTLSIGGDMRAGGRGGCNSWFAQAQSSGDALAFSAVAATRMACASADATSQETAFFGALAATRFWRVDAGQLTLSDAAGADVVVLQKSLF